MAANERPLKVFGNSPKNLPSPVPETVGTDQDNAVADAVRSKPVKTAGAGASATDLEPTDEEILALALAQSPQADEGVEAPEAEQSFARQAIDYIPAANSLVMGTLGFLSPIPGGAAIGAGVGAAGGHAIKTYLQEAIFGEAPPTLGEYATDVAIEGVTNAALQSQKVMKAAGAVARPVTKYVGKMLTPVGELAIDTYMKAPPRVRQVFETFKGDVTQAADTLRTKFTSAVNEAKGAIEKPVLEFMAKGMTTLDERETGEAVKQIIKKTVQKKYAPFQEAYGTLRQINEAVPIPDEARKQVGDSILAWANRKFPQNEKMYRTIKQKVLSLQASNNGAQFESVIKGIAGEADAAYRAGNSEMATVLRDLKSHATEFLDTQVEGLATRISKAQASPQEIGFLKKVLQTKGLNPMDPATDIRAQKLAREFLAGKKKINQDYAGFKGFMEDLSDATKVRSSRGTMNFLHDLDGMDAEVIVKRMSDPKRTAMLERMKAEVPDAFKQLAGLQIRRLSEKSVANGTLDIPLFHKNISALPKQVQKLLFSPDELKLIKETAINPKLNSINKVLGEIDDKLLKAGTDHGSLVKAGTQTRLDNRGLSNLGKLSTLTGVNMVQDVLDLGAMAELSNAAKLSRAHILKKTIDAGHAVSGKGAKARLVRGAAGRPLTAAGKMAGEVVRNRMAPDEE